MVNRDLSGRGDTSIDPRHGARETPNPARMAHISIQSGTFLIVCSLLYSQGLLHDAKTGWIDREREMVYKNPPQPSSPVSLRKAPFFFIKKNGKQRFAVFSPGFSIDCDCRYSPTNPEWRFLRLIYCQSVTLHLSAPSDERTISSFFFLCELVYGTKSSSNRVTDRM